MGTWSSSAALAASSAAAGAVLLREREDAEDAPHAGGALVVVDVGADRVEVRAGVARPREERERRPPACAPADRRRRCDDSPRGARTMLAQQLAGLGIEQADVEIGPLHLDALPDPAGRRRVVRGLDFDAAIEMHGAHAEAVVAKRLDRQRLQRGPLLGKHRGDLALGRAVDAGVGPVRVPAIEIRLRLLEASRSAGRAAASSACGRCRIRPCPCDRDRRRDTAADDAVVREHVAIERIERRLVDVGREHALFEIVEDDRPRRAAQPPKRALVQLGPRLRARLPHQQPHGFARVARASGQRAASADTCRSADGGPSAPRRSRPAPSSPGAVVMTTRASGGACAAQLPDEAPDTRVAGGEAVVVDEVLPDRHRIAADARAPRRSARDTARTHSRCGARDGAESVDTTAAKLRDLPGVGGHLRRKWPVLPSLRSGRPRPRTGMPAARR